MLAVKSMDARDNFKDWCNQVTQGETLIVSRSKNENVVIISEKEYNEMQKTKRNAEYLSKLDRGFADMEHGKGITKTLEELEAMAADE